MKTSTLRPGFLVSLKTSVVGGVSYQRTDLETAHQTDGGAVEARWETTKTVFDPEEHERALQARNRCRALVIGQCARSEFGYLCPTNREAELDKAVAEAKAVADAFNASATSTRIEVYVLAATIAQDDVEAARAIGSEVRGLLAAMDEGIKAADPEAIRDAANRARALGAMLSDEVQGKVTAAIAQAREAAKEITRRVSKAGELAATVVAELRTNEIETARFAFLDLDQPGRNETLPLPLPLPVAGLDLAPAEALPALAAMPAAPAIPVLDVA